MVLFGKFCTVTLILKIFLLSYTGRKGKLDEVRGEKFGVWGSVILSKR